MSDSLFTIGYSHHSFDDFVQLLQLHGITALADVRSHPTSRLVQFKYAHLSSELSVHGIDYVFLGKELGARRDERAAYEDDQVQYEKVAQLPLFLQGLERLKVGISKYRLALMCAEKEPLDCHRTILICHKLRDWPIQIQHILSDGTLEEHATTEQRLVQKMEVSRTLFEPDLSDEELMQRAYQKRAGEIAYRLPEPDED